MEKLLNFPASSSEQMLPLVMGSAVWGLWGPSSFNVQLVAFCCCSKPGFTWMSNNQFVVPQTSSNFRFFYVLKFNQWLKTSINLRTARTLLSVWNIFRARQHHISVDFSFILNIFVERAEVTSAHYILPRWVRCLYRFPQYIIRNCHFSFM